MEIINGETHFTITLSTPKLLKFLADCGSKYVGLDAVWKYTELNIPIWVLVVEHPNGGSVVVLYVISTSGTTENIKNALSPVLALAGIKPYVMIDHDEAERAAIRQLDVSIFC